MDSPLSTADEVYDKIVKGLPGVKQLRLIERIAHDFAVQAESEALSEDFEAASDEDLIRFETALAKESDSNG